MLLSRSSCVVRCPSGLNVHFCKKSPKLAQMIFDRYRIHLEKDMSVPFGHTVARTVCLFEILCAPKSVECAFLKLYVPQMSVMKCINEFT